MLTIGAANPVVSSAAQSVSFASGVSAFSKSTFQSQLTATHVSYYKPDGRAGTIPVIVQESGRWMDRVGRFFGLGGLRGDWSIQEQAIPCAVEERIKLEQRDLEAVIQGEHAWQGETGLEALAKVETNFMYLPPESRRKVLLDFCKKPPQPTEVSAVSERYFELLEAVLGYARDVQLLGKEDREELCRALLEPFRAETMSLNGHQRSLLLRQLRLILSVLDGKERLWMTARLIPLQDLFQSPAELRLAYEKLMDECLQGVELADLVYAMSGQTLAYSGAVDIRILAYVQTHAKRLSASAIVHVVSNILPHTLHRDSRVRFKAIEIIRDLFGEVSEDQQLWFHLEVKRFVTMNLGTCDESIRVDLQALHKKVDLTDQQVLEIFKHLAGQRRKGEIAEAEWGEVYLPAYFAAAEPEDEAFDVVELGVTLVALGGVEDLLKWANPLAAMEKRLGPRQQEFLGEKIREIYAGKLWTHLTELLSRPEEQWKMALPHLASLLGEALSGDDDALRAFLQPHANAESQEEIDRKFNVILVLAERLEPSVAEKAKIKWGPVIRDRLGLKEDALLDGPLPVMLRDCRDTARVNAFLNSAKAANLGDIARPDDERGRSFAWLEKQFRILAAGVANDYFVRYQEKYFFRTVPLREEAEILLGFAWGLLASPQDYDALCLRRAWETPPGSGFGNRVSLVIRNKIGDPLWMPENILCRQLLFLQPELADEVRNRLFRHSDAKIRMMAMQDFLPSEGTDSSGVKDWVRRLLDGIGNDAAALATAAPIITQRDTGYCELERFTPLFHSPSVALSEEIIQSFATMFRRNPKGNAFVLRSWWDAKPGEQRLFDLLRILQILGPVSEGIYEKGLLYLNNAKTSKIRSAAKVALFSSSRDWNKALKRLEDMHDDEEAILGMLALIDPQFPVEAIASVARFCDDSSPAIAAAAKAAAIRCSQDRLDHVNECIRKWLDDKKNDRQRLALKMIRALRLQQWQDRVKIKMQHNDPSVSAEARYVWKALQG